MEYYHPSEVHPHGTRVCLHTVLEQAPVAGLAIARVETVLEHGGLDVIPLVLFLGRKVFYLSSQPVCLDLGVLEVAPARLVVPRYPPPLMLTF